MDLNYPRSTDYPSGKWLDGYPRATVVLDPYAVRKLQMELAHIQQSKLQHNLHSNN